LSLLEREEISRGLAAGHSLRAIAAGLGRSPSTVCREVAANGGRRRYRAASADKLAWARAARPKPTKLSTCVALRELVTAKLELDWSPQQIAGWLQVEYPNEAGMQVSHETIYRSLFVQPRGGLRKELTNHLRTRRATNPPPAGRATPTGWSRPPPEHPAHLAATGRGRGPRRPWSLGRRPCDTRSHEWSERADGRFAGEGVVPGPCPLTCPRSDVRRW
jgi:IS30 family transposase